MNKISRLEFIALVRKKIFYIPLCLMVIIIGGFYAGQDTSSATNNVAGILTSNIKYNDQQIKEIKQSGKAIPAWLSKEQKLMKTIQGAFDNHEWSKVAKARIKLIDIDAADAKANHITAKQDPGLIYFQRQKVMLQYVQKHNVYPDLHNKAITGLGFTLDSLNILFPMIFIVIMIFMFGGAFAKKYQNQQNMNHLFPIADKVLDNSRLVASFAGALAIYLIIIVSALLLGTVFNGLGALQFPIIVEVAKGIPTLPIWLVIVKTMVLQILGLYSCLVFAQVLNNILKNQILTIMTTVLLVYMQCVAPIFLRSFASIMHLLPGVYLNGGYIVDNHTATITGNSAVTFDHGIIVLGIWIAVLHLISCAQSRLIKRRVKWPSKEIYA